MKRILLLLSMFLFLISCEEADNTAGELNITLKSISGASSTSGAEESFTLCPNPFGSVLYFHNHENDKAEIFIYGLDDRRGKKFSFEGNSGTFDFSEEKTGAYLVEVLIDGVLFREYLIKED